jgi:hypothetical protein
MTHQDGGQRLHVKVWIGWLAILLGISAVVYSCISRDAREKERKDAASAEQKQQEIAAFSTPEAARATIEERLALRVGRDGLTLVVNSADALHTISVLPVTVPWVVSCDRVGLALQLGNTASDPDAPDAVFIPIVPPERAAFLSVEKCKELAPIIGNVMTIMTFVPGRFR